MNKQNELASYNLQEKTIKANNDIRNCMGQNSQNILFKKITGAPWYMRREHLRRDLRHK